MKRVLITGANSCVGMCVEKWLKQWAEKYSVDTLDMQGDSWRQYDFSDYDTVYHVAGKAHVTLDPSLEDIFYKVNRDLTIETAKVAKAAGVKQFIFMSSGIVYGDSSHIGKSYIIAKDTQPNPANFYGMSKLQGEQGIQKLSDENFKVVIIRSPALYGIGMKSHYNNLSAFAKKYHFFPNIKNQRSMLYNKNLAEFVRLMIDNEENGMFWPQNGAYTCTADMIKDIAEANNRHIYLIKLFNPLIRVVARRVASVDKALGSFTYDQSMSDYKCEYRICDYHQSIKEIESDNGKLIIEKLM